MKSNPSPQLDRVCAVMSDGRWRTLFEVAAVTGDPVASVSARLRDLRKATHGGNVVERRRRLPGGGTYEYRLSIGTADAATEARS